jgi:DNA-binding transcriptional LysR family regulator
MGKAMVAAGLGISVLPDFSIVADPLVRAGVLTTRPIRTDETTVTLLMLRRRAERTSEPLHDLQAALVRQARAYLGSLELTPVTPISSRARSLSAR